MPRRPDLRRRGPYVTSSQDRARWRLREPTRSNVQRLAGRVAREGGADRKFAAGSQSGPREGPGVSRRRWRESRNASVTREKA